MFGTKKSAAQRFGMFTVTFLVGAAVGVGLGLLYAPKAGRKLNKDLKKGYDKVKDVVEDQAEIVAHGLRDAGNVVRDTVRKVASA
jgi:gas vesicle protein